jgi:hypothetical protein
MIWQSVRSLGLLCWWAEVVWWFVGKSEWHGDPSRSFRSYRSTGKVGVCYCLGMHGLLGMYPY